MGSEKETGMYGIVRDLGGGKKSSSRAIHSFFGLVTVWIAQVGAGWCSRGNIRPVTGWTVLAHTAGKY